MTRKDYVVLAVMIAELDPRENRTPDFDQPGDRDYWQGRYSQWASTATKLADLLGDDSDYDLNGNRRFDRERFLTACGLPLAGKR